MPKALICRSNSSDPNQDQVSWDALDRWMEQSPHSQKSIGNVRLPGTTWDPQTHSCCLISWQIAAVWFEFWEKYNKIPMKSSTTAINIKNDLWQMNVYTSFFLHSYTTRCPKNHSLEDSRKHLCFLSVNWQTTRICMERKTELRDRYSLCIGYPINEGWINKVDKLAVIKFMG